MDIYAIGSDVFAASLLELAKSGKGADVNAMVASAASSAAYDMFVKQWIKGMGLPAGGATDLLVKSAVNIMLKQLIESFMKGGEYKMQIPDIQDLAGGVLTVTASEKIYALWTPGATV